MNNKRIKSTQKPKKHKPSYTSDNDSIKSSDSDEEYGEKSHVDVAVDGDDVAGEDVEETVGEKRKRAAEEYLERIPFDIQEEIIKTLPIKSLVQFRLVSKQWKSLIDSSKFIVEYHIHQKHKHHHLLVCYQTFDRYYDDKYVSIVDDESFPQHKVSLTVPTSLNILTGPKIVSSQGLLFLHCFDACSGTRKALIWNPTIRKSVNIDIRGVCSPAYFGFGVCPDTCDPKIVKLPYYRYAGDTICEVFTLSTNAWRRLPKNLPREYISFTQGNQVAIDRFMYWLAYEDIYEDDRCELWYERNFIVSFNMKSEEFTEINLPGSLEAYPKENLRIHNIRESLGVVQIKRVSRKQIYSVWKMMELGVSNSFIQLYTINTRDVIEDIYGFRRSSEPIVETENNPDQMDLFAYDPDSKHINYIEIPGRHIFSVNSYIETLLLLDH